MKRFALQIQTGGVWHEIARLSSESEEWAMRRFAEKLLMFCGDDDMRLQELETTGNEADSDGQFQTPIISRKSRMI